MPMCGRYIFTEEPRKLYKRYDIEASKKIQLEIKTMYNIAPGFLVPVITGNSPNAIEIMKWGLIPHWAKDPKIGYKLINARAETVAQKPGFRASFRNKRCLVPATGFYEWQPTKAGKVPHLIQMKSREIFSFAGIFDVWKDVEGKEFKTFSIITTSPNELMQPIHNRMPVILKKKQEELWLEKEAPEESLIKLLKPFPENKMEAFIVSTRVNSPRNQDKELIQKV